jgi:hypothetical protein
LLNGQEAFYLKKIGRKRTYMLLNPWWNLFSLGYKKIDMCPNFDMLYYLENTNLIEYKTLGHARYKPKTGSERTFVAYRKFRYFPIILRLQIFFISQKTIEHMTWYHSYNAVVGVTVYHFDGETQKHFNRMHPQFLIVPCNVHFGLCTDKFNPFKSFTASYSYRLVILMVYNLSRRMCMRLKFMFLSTVIPGPNSLSRNIDDYLQPLIDELK